ncbi:MAG TPA: cation transporter [Sporichthyaceae bacterium]|nr:cation transporter [Sporichthyaceae bacterium]
MATVYSVTGMSCQHCVDAITSEVGQVTGVSGVAVDLAASTVTVEGAVDDAAVRAAIDEAGYAVA